ncbi:hypothetical protein Salat_2727200 [Sesamum alatum]|uniref:Uncharacterized protein n=1 Tax=Sesamum alatum TaxID=300844 RepID=A0AAE2C8P3_9LAMI|nr:hypothetical protein Salat_2727200 [Sesamum alatum]
MKMRNKVHPFISSSSSSTKDSFPVLNLLPAAILTLISVLSVEDRQVLAYMITRSLKSSNPPSQDKKQKTSKKQQPQQQSLVDSHGRHSPPLFDCDCFHCYTSFWFRWDSSPNRELIHQAIEAFEEHLTNSEQFNKNAKNRKKEKTGRRKNDRVSAVDAGGSSRVLEFPPQQNQESLDLVPTPASELGMEDVVNDAGVAAEEESGGGADPEDDLATAAPVVVVRNHKGLARKVLPDVMGIFSSRLWSLWSPNV